MKIEFTKAHTLKENRTSYKKGDTLDVSSSIAKRLIDGGIAKDVVEKAATKKETKTKEPK